MAITRRIAVVSGNLTIPVQLDGRTGPANGDTGVSTGTSGYLQNSLTIFPFRADN
jgi:hypothetical protein